MAFIARWWNTLPVILLLSTTSCKVTGPSGDSQLSATSSGQMTWKDVVKKHCRSLDLGGRYKEDDVFKCVKKLEATDLTEEEVKAFTNPPEDQPAGKVSKMLETAIAEVEVIMDSDSKTKATEINKVFSNYRDGVGDRPSVEDMLTDLTERSSRLKMTIYLVGAMIAGEKLQAKQAFETGGETRPPMPKEQKIATATLLVDGIEAEACIRGLKLRTIWIFGGKPCRRNDYREWSDMRVRHFINRDFNKVFGKRDNWTKNHVILMENGPVVTDDEPSIFDTRMALLRGNWNMLNRSMQDRLKAVGIKEGDLKRIEKNKTSYMFMWGIYDEPISQIYVDYFKNGYQGSGYPDRRFMMIDMNVATKNRHNKIQAAVENTGTLLGKTAPDHNPGSGMHRKALMIDSRYMVMGGRNFSTEYTKYWRDTDVLVVGPATFNAAEYFVKQDLANIESSGSSSDPGDVTMSDAQGPVGSSRKVVEKFLKKVERNAIDRVLVLDSSPSQRSHDHIMAAHLWMITNAAPGTTVQIENAYLILTEPLREAFYTALKKGVKFHIHSNSVFTADEPAVTMPIMLSVREILEMPALLRSQGADISDDAVTLKLRQARYIDLDYNTDEKGKPVHKAWPNGGGLTHNLTKAQLGGMVQGLDNPEAESKPSTLHSKYMTAMVKSSSGKLRGYTLVTSYNLHPRSHRYEDEMAILVRSDKYEDPRSAYAQLSTWFKSPDPLTHVLKGSPFGTISFSDPEKIVLKKPVDWNDPRALPQGGMPMHGHWLFINNVAAAAMTIGFDQL